MIWALLAILGVPIWLVVGALAATLWSRWHFSHQPGVFKVKIRMHSGTFEGLGKKWPFGAAWALWVHDVLLVHKGPAMLRTMALPIVVAEGDVKAADPKKVKRLGDNPVLMQFRLDNQATIQLAAPGDSQVLACGPFASHFVAGEPRLASVA